MTYREIRKNSAETVRIAARRYQGHDLIDIRVFARTKDGSVIPTKKGVSLNIDLVPDLLECLEWALQQPCDEVAAAEEVRPLTEEDAARLARRAHSVLKKHGVPVHWDVAESMVISERDAGCFTKWHLHYVLATRRDLFVKEEAGCYRAR